MLYPKAYQSNVASAALRPANKRFTWIIQNSLPLYHIWKLRDGDTRALLGGMSSGGFYALKNRATKTLNEDQLTRISLSIGIYKALNILYGQKLADAWIALPNTNPMFGGDSPLNYVKKGGIPAFLRVHQLLDARRGGR
jgi:Antitoxin Xre/MbcA/ParS C-terminal toxin-binding domain